MNSSRRQILKGLLGGGAGLAAMATGLPISFLRSPLAFGAECSGSSPEAARFLILASSSAGDPFNANVPGTYGASNIVHPPTDDFAPTPVSLGGVSTTAARIYSTMPEWVRARASFIHHATRTGTHPEMPKVLRLLGATTGNDMLPSVIAGRLAACLGTIQAVPVNVGDRVDLKAGGATLPSLRPTALKQLLGANDSPLFRLRGLRDQRLDALHAILKADGTPTQRRYLDARAATRAQVRQLAEGAAELFEGIVDDTPAAQLLAALGLVRLGVSPVVTVSLRFGGDNHVDPGLLDESTEHVQGIEALNTFMTAVDAAGLRDRVTFAMLNVFGRTLAQTGLAGRGHSARHAVSLLVGPGIAGGVVGGVAPFEDDFTSLGIDSATGQAAPGGGDIPYEETLTAVGATIYAATGLDEALRLVDMRGGKVIRGALTSA